MIGQTFSHFKILEKLGEGGMGAVYLAQDTELDRKVALKFLPEQFASDQDALARFKREAKAAAALNHPNIITIYEVGQHGDKPFIAMAHVEGDLLTDVIANNLVSTNRAIGFAIQICSGLEKAHNAGIVHRDIKPGNLLVDRDGRVKILDFGLAKVRGVTKLTDEHSTIGTLNYMSPEQARGEEVDHRSDLFSLGVVLYEMLAGRLPFTGEHPAAVMYAIASEEPQPLSRFNNDAPENLCRILERALAKDPTVRYQSAADLAADLRRSAEKHPSAGPGPRRDKRKLLLPALAAAIIVAGLLIFKPFKVEISPDGPAMAGENKLAVMYFENMIDRADSTRMGEIATNLLITDMSESGDVKVVSSQRLYDILKLKGKEGAKLINRGTATEVARYAGARWMLLGSILQMEPTVLITAQLVDVGTGEIEASQRVVGAPGEQVFALIDRLSDEVRKDLELPAVSSVSEISVADATTHNPEAYRSYLEGIDYERRYYRSKALDAFKRAAELDPNFAMAHYALARMIPNNTERLREIERAQELSSNLGQREKRYINSLYSYIHGDFDNAIHELELLIEAYPDEKDAYRRLGGLYLYQGRDERQSIRYLRRAIEIDPLFKDAYNILAYLYQKLEEFDNAIWAITQYINLAPDEPNPYDSRGQMYAMEGKLDQAIESYKKALAIDPEFYSARRGLGHMYLFKRDYEKARQAYQLLVDSDDPKWRTKGRGCLANIPRTQGKWEESTRMLLDGIAADEQESGEYKYIGPMEKLLSLAIVNSAVTQEEGLAYTRSGIDLFRRFDPSSPLVMWWKAMELFWQLQGEQITPADAGTAFASLRLKIENESPQDLPALVWVEGNIAFEQDRYEDAIELFNEAISFIKSWPWRYPLLKSYFQTGRIEEAVILAERMLGSYDSLRARSLWSVKIHFLAGQVYQAAGQTEKAIEQLETFLMIWKDADPIFPEIDDAKRRLEVLKRSS